MTTDNSILTSDSSESKGCFFCGDKHSKQYFQPFMNHWLCEDMAACDARMVENRKKKLTGGKGMNYTKGEWQIKSTDFDDYVIWAEHCMPDEDIEICIIQQNTKKMMKANAHLIAAAPEMYEALKLLLERMEMYPDYPIGFELVKVQAEKALAKAEASK